MPIKDKQKGLLKTNIRCIYLMAGKEVLQQKLGLLRTSYVAETTYVLAYIFFFCSPIILHTDENLYYEKQKPGFFLMDETSRISKSYDLDHIPVLNFLYSLRSHELRPSKKTPQKIQI